jgi:hypothetical protein
VKVARPGALQGLLGQWSLKERHPGPCQRWTAAHGPLIPAHTTIYAILAAAAILDSCRCLPVARHSLCNQHSNGITELDTSTRQPPNTSFSTQRLILSTFNFFQVKVTPVNAAVKQCIADLKKAHPDVHLIIGMSHTGVCARACARAYVCVCVCVCVWVCVHVCACVHVARQFIEHVRIVSATPSNNQHAAQDSPWANTSAIACWPAAPPSTHAPHQTFPCTQPNNLPFFLPSLPPKATTQILRPPNKCQIWISSSAVRGQAMSHIP